MTRERSPRKPRQWFRLQNLPFWLSKLSRNRFALRAAKMFLQPLAGVLMIHGPWAAVILWLAFAQDLRWAGFAVLGLVMSEAASLMLRADSDPESEGSLRTNALLTTLAVTWLLPARDLHLAAQLGLVAISALTAAILAAAVARALRGTNLPPLVWGYCAVASALFIIFPEAALASALAIDWGGVPTGLGAWAVTFFQTLGAFLFAPHVGAGMAIAGAILLWSRTMFFAGVVGWISGVATALVLTELDVIFYWLPAAYNSFLAGMALGSVYFLPGWAGLGTAAFAGCIAAFGAVALQYLLNFSPAAFLPLPFSLTVWIGIGALQSGGLKSRLMRNRFPEMCPERAWRLTALDIAKWGRHEDLLMIPVTGEVEITQGFSGRLSHIGRWRHALDFQRPARKSRIAARNSSIFGAKVLAPAPGIVERVQDNVPDNAAGVSNYAENWGNHVIIRLDVGGWALLAHLRQGSVTVPVGSRVGFGTVLGEVGNSGRSPVPHLHLQVQEAPALGEATLPFRLANYLYAENPDDPLTTWTAAAIPVEGTRLKAAKPNPDVHQLLAGMSPGRAQWSVEVQGEVPAEFRPPVDSTSLRIDISLDSAGRQVFGSRDGGRMVSRFDLDAWRTVEFDAAASPFLRLLSLAAPCVPYAAAKGVRWSDIALIEPGSSARWLQQSLRPFHAAPFTALESRCESSPSGSDALLAIATRPANPHPRLPKRMLCQFRQIEGPQSLAAEFERGSISYALYSFLPAQPVRADAD